MNQLGWIVIALLVMFGIVAAIDTVSQYSDVRKVRQACFDAGFADTLHAGDHWYCTRKRAGNDEVVEVHRLHEVPK